MSGQELVAFGESGMAVMLLYSGGFVGIGVVSLVAALALPRWPALSGLVFFLMGPLHGLNGWWTGRRVERAVGARVSS